MFVSIIIIKEKIYNTCIVTAILFSGHPYIGRHYRASLIHVTTTHPVFIGDLAFINPRPEGYGSRFVVHFSFYLSTALQTTSSCQLRYEEAKHVDGLQSDGWILLKCFRSRFMAGSP